MCCLVAGVVLCRCLATFCDDDTNEQIQEVVDSGVVGRLVELLSHPNCMVRDPVLHAVGLIVSGDELQTQVMIDAGVLPALLPLITGQDRSAVRQAAWAVSNGQQRYAQPLEVCAVVVPFAIGSRWLVCVVLCV